MQYSSAIKKTQGIRNDKILQVRPRTVEQIESYIKQEWANNPLPKVQQLVSSVPRCLQTEMLHSGKHGAIPPVLRHVTAINFKTSLYFS